LTHTDIPHSIMALFSYLLLHLRYLKVGHRRVFLRSFHIQKYPSIRAHINIWMETPSMRFQWSFIQSETNIISAVKITKGKLWRN